MGLRVIATCIILYGELFYYNGRTLERLQPFITMLSGDDVDVTLFHYIHNSFLVESLI